MALKNNLRLLGLSTKEEKVLRALMDCKDTPLLIARATKVSRPAIYAILNILHERGIAVRHTVNGKKKWAIADERGIEETLYDAKRTLLDIPHGREELRGSSDSMVIVHRGLEAIKKVMPTLFAAHKHERFFWGFQGDIATAEWNKTFSLAETNRINREIKNNGIITEAILPAGWLEEQTKLLGALWAKDFEGRTARVNIIDPSYFKHGGQCWVFRDALYLFSLSEQLVIEIRNSEIQKMVLAIFQFMQDASITIDANEVLRKLISKN
ncbi:MAG: helix-turn-helix domain-containing protein [Minisyncoccia bacterium]